MRTVDVDIGYKPHVHQKAIHAAMLMYRFCVLVCHRRFGKTLLAVHALVDAALRCKKPNGRYAYCAPYLKQAKQIAWLYLLGASLAIPGTRKNETELYVEFPNGARVTLYGADNAEALRGNYFDGIVLDEPASMRPHVWGEIIRPALADRKGWVLFIGTPHGMDHFYELYQHAQNDPAWYSCLYRADETDLPWLDGDELGLLRAMMSDNEYRQEMLCDFTASSDNILITIDVVSAACARKIVSEEDLIGYPKLIGVDVARFGDDDSSVIKRWGPLVYKPQIFPNIDNMQLVGIVSNLIDEWDPDAVFIDGGRGEGVIDRLRQLKYDNIVEVQFGAKAANPHYANKATEIWDTMAQHIVARAVLPNDPRLKTDLCSVVYSFDASNRMKREPKEKMKERGMKSTDVGDSLAVTYAHPVNARERHSKEGRVRTRQTFAQEKYVPPWQRV